jgi:murein DD-endopeptidase MepM/ murein hydrolase activator NlpD
VLTFWLDGAKLQRPTPKRILILVFTCIAFICSSVVLINLQSPPNANIGVIRGSHSEPIPGVGSNNAEAEGPRATTGNSQYDRAQPGLVGSGEVDERDLEYLRAKHLLIPVSGVDAAALRDSFSEARSEGRTHQALDIAAPQGTPVLATADGIVRKLFVSARGGIMLYETDPAEPFVYYYAHLQRYADDMNEGKWVRRGDVIAFVGDTGNAGSGNFHLHFGIAKTAAIGKWSGGQAINPYPLLLSAKA